MQFLRWYTNPSLIQRLFISDKDWMRVSSCENLWNTASSDSLGFIGCSVLDFCLICFVWRATRITKSLSKGLWQRLILGKVYVVVVMWMSGSAGELSLSSSCLLEFLTWQIMRRRRVCEFGLWCWQVDPTVLWSGLEWEGTGNWEDGWLDLSSSAGYSRDQTRYTPVQLQLGEKYLASLTT